MVLLLLNQTIPVKFYFMLVLFLFTKAGAYPSSVPAVSNSIPGMFYFRLVYVFVQGRVMSELVEFLSLSNPLELC